MTAIVTGRKDDAGKLRWSLLPWGSLRRVVNVLEFGAKKYGDHNWMRVDNARARYSDALLRHVIAYVSGERCDADTGESHLAHAACCALFLMWFDDQEPTGSIEWVKR